MSACELVLIVLMAFQVVFLAAFVVAMVAIEFAWRDLNRKLKHK